MRTRRAHKPRRPLAALAVLTSVLAFAPTPARAQSDNSTTTTTEATQRGEEPAPAGAAATTESSLRVVGELDAPAYKGECGGTREVGPCPLVVDPVNNVGFALGCDRMRGSCADKERSTRGGTVGPSLRVYDLERLVEVDRLPNNDPGSRCPLSNTDVVLPANQSSNLWRCGMLQAGAFDTARQMLWVPTDVDSTNAGSGAWCGLLRYDYAVVTAVVGRSVFYECTVVCTNDSSVAGDCTYRPPSAALPRPLTHLRVVFDGAHPDPAGGTVAHLYVAGAYGEEVVRRPVGSVLPRNAADLGFENAGQALIVRQLRVTSSPSGAAAHNRTVPHTSATPGLAYGWDVDLRGAGCGRRVGLTSSDPEGLRPFVARMGDDLLAYCWDARPAWWSPGPGGVGEQGYVVRIPLNPATDAPFGEPDLTGLYTNYRYVRTPALAGYLEATADASSGMVLLVTDGKANGNAVWVFDPHEDRFIAVATGGAADQPLGNTALGVDQSRGRVYLLTRGGLLVVPTRTRPLSGGLLFDLPQLTNATGLKNFVNYSSIAVAPALGRLFVPVNQPDQEYRGAPGCGPTAGASAICSSEKGARWLVVEDVYPEDLSPLADDPDANTTQVDEAKDTTEVSARGQAAAAGAHVIVAGGVVRTVDQADPGCHARIPLTMTDPTGNPFLYVDADAEAERGRATVDYGGPSVGPFGGAPTPEGAQRVVDLYGQSGGQSQPFSGEGCAASQVVAGGKREVFLARASAEVGNETGVNARAGGFDFGADDATGSDLRNVGGCGRGTGTNVRAEFEPVFDGTDQACTPFWDGVADGGGPDPRAGTAGASGKGLVGAACGDYGTTPGTDVWPKDSQVGEQLVASKTVCDATKVLASASATTSGPLVLADQGTVLVSVARTWSKLASAKTADEGQVSAVASGAEGIRIGPVFISKAVSVAVTKAKGRTGKAEATLIRRWCGISIETPSPDNDTNTELVPQGACVDPSGEEAQSLLATLNQVLSKVHLSVPPSNSETEEDGTVEEGEDSPGGFQATIVKDPDTRAGDSAVNDDETHTVSALEAVFYNDGSQGRNRVVLQLAGVAAESRYGIREVPDFGAFEDDPVADEGVEEEAAPEVAAIADPGPAPAVDLPQSSGEGFRTAAVADIPREDITVEELLDDIVPTVATQPVYRGSRGFIDDLPGPVRAVARALRDAIRLLVNSPAQFGLLFATFGLLAAPLYLGWRRRSFARALLS